MGHLLIFFKKGIIMHVKSKVFLLFWCFFLAYAPTVFASFINECPSSNKTLVETVGDYEIYQITDNENDDLGPNLNSDNIAIWKIRLSTTAGNYSKTRVCYYDGEQVSTITPVAGNQYIYSYALNELGHVASSEYNDVSRPQFTGVSIFDGLVNTQIIPQGSLSGFNNDYLLWSNSWNIYLYDGTGSYPIATGLTNPSRPMLNESGQVVYATRELFSTRPIFKPYVVKFYDGNDTISLSHMGYNNKWPWLNDLGQVLWYNSTTFNNPKYHMYQNGVDQVFTDLPAHARVYGFNNSGHIVWLGSSNRIYLYSDSVSLEIPRESLPNAIFDIKLTENGNFAWYELSGYEIVDGEQDLTKPIYGLYIYNGSDVIQLAKGRILGFDFNINDDLIWSASDGNDFEIYLSSVQKDPCTIVSDIIDDLQNLNLPKQDINSYLANLKKVCSFNQREQLAAATNQLEATIKKIEQDVSHNGAITPVADEFIERIQRLIDLITNP